MDSEPSLLWIDLNSTETFIPKDRSTRTKIRRHAMKRVGASWKRNINRIEHNNRQQPLFIPKDNTSTSRNESHNAKTTPSSHQIPIREAVQCFHHLPDPSFIRYQSLCNRYGLDPLSLSFLTSIAMNRATARTIAAKPHRIPHFLGRRYDSYLSHLPSRYGHTPCLTDALDCVVARTRALISPEAKWERLAALAYGRALQALQSALKEPEPGVMLASEVLCATLVLGLYELLNCTARECAWFQHVGGGALLIRSRGAGSFETEFEKDLFISHVGPIITESLFNNENCFLEQPEWQQLLFSVVTESPRKSQRNEIVIKLFAIMTSLPRIFKDVTSVICHESRPSISKVAILLSRAYVIRARFKSYRSTYLSKNVFGPGGVLRGILAILYTCIILCNRLITALTRHNSKDFEQEAQYLANEVLAMYQQSDLSELNESSFLAQENCVAEATIATHKVWSREMQVYIRRGPGSSATIKRETFERWCSLLGRKTEPLSRSLLNCPRAPTYRWDRF